MNNLHQVLDNKEVNKAHLMDQVVVEMVMEVHHQVVDMADPAVSEVIHF